MNLPDQLYRTDGHDAPAYIWGVPLEIEQNVQGQMVQ